MPEIKIAFPGGSKVNATFLDFEVATDQRKEHGGQSSAPNPFDYFFVSIATCAGSSAMGFCQKHNISMDGLEVWMETIKHESEPRIASIKIHLSLPDHFPEKAKAGLIKSVESCTVKRHILTPPVFETVVHRK